MDVVFTAVVFAGVVFTDVVFAAVAFAVVVFVADVFAVAAVVVLVFVVDAVDDVDDVLRPFFLLASVDEELEEDVDEEVRLLEEVVDSLRRPITIRKMFVFCLLVYNCFVFVFLLPLNDRKEIKEQVFL